MFVWRFFYKNKIMIEDNLVIRECMGRIGHYVLLIMMNTNIFIL